MFRIEFLVWFILTDIGILSTSDSRNLVNLIGQYRLQRHNYDVETVTARTFSRAHNGKPPIDLKVKARIGDTNKQANLHERTIIVVGDVPKHLHSKTKHDIQLQFTID